MIYFSSLTLLVPHSNKSSIFSEEYLHEFLFKHLPVIYKVKLKDKYYLMKLFSMLLNDIIFPLISGFYPICL